MKVFKFGGASVRHAAAIRQVASIIERYSHDQLVVVVSAMGKTTNALERMLGESRSGRDFEAELAQIVDFHKGVMKELFPPSHPVWKKAATEFERVPALLAASMEFDQLYDQVISLGEVLSSIIVSEFLLTSLPVHWADARQYVLTDATHREGRVDWNNTEKKIQELKPILQKQIVVTQGFVGRSPEGYTTTLGREGSDYSAAIFAACLSAESVTIWKDVPGVMNADPKRLPRAVVFEELPFREAAEMTYYGASVIHPKTIKPLANKNIPLLVKNFDDPTLPGTVIHEIKLSHLPPLIVFKDNQCLVSCRVTDYTFISENQLSSIFSVVAGLDIKINVMQNSAISFSFCIDFREDKVLKLIERLSTHFEVYYNTGLTLITVKNYDAATSDHYRKLPGILLEQSSRSTIQVLIKV